MPDLTQTAERRIWVEKWLHRVKFLPPIPIAIAGLTAFLKPSTSLGCAITAFISTLLIAVIYGWLLYLKTTPQLQPEELPRPS